MDNLTPPGPPQSPFPPTSEPVPHAGSFQKPADYYSGATPPPAQERKGCPKWIPITCGLGCLLIVILVIVGGGWAARGGASRFLAYAISKAQNDIMDSTTSDVSPEEKSELNDELAQLRANIENNQVKLLDLQPVLQTMQEVTGDGRVTPEEVSELRDLLARVNGSR